MSLAKVPVLVNAFLPNLQVHLFVDSLSGQENTVDYAIDILPMGQLMIVARTSGIVWSLNKMTILQMNNGVWFLIF